MTVLWHRVAILVSLVSVFLWWFIFYITPFKANTCNKMVDEIKSDSRRAKLMAFATSVANRNSLNTIWKETEGIIHHHLLVDKSLYDDTLLDSLESLESPPTIELHGKNINYNDLTKSEIESVAIGLGQRAFILIDVDKNGVFSENSYLYMQSDIKAAIGQFLVICRND